MPKPHFESKTWLGALCCWAPPNSQAHRNRLLKGVLLQTQLLRQPAVSQLDAHMQEALAKLPKLQRLVAINNQLRTLPLAFGHMRHIKELNLGCATI